MKKILITGANSYIGTSFEKYLDTYYPKQYLVDTVDMRDGVWKEKSFAGYDVVYHVAGIAHIDIVTPTPKQEEQYRVVNTELAIETAKKAKADGVKQFIFMSSASVYGDSAPIGKEKMITEDTPVSPASCYGRSKVAAESGLCLLRSEQFKVVILRPPMIYGKDSKGNYPKLKKLALTLPIFPYVNNQRSMLYVDNLAEFVRLMVENEEDGLFWPQNAEYSNTSDIVKKIAEKHRKSIRLLKGVTWLLKILSHCTGMVNKAFGSLTYTQQMSAYKQEYRRFTLEESLTETEKS